LSGGNLQKFIVGRETKLAPKVMVVAQPTWGVDVGAAQMIRQALIDLRGRGVALLVVSEELDELFMVCDRISVLAGGRLSQPMSTADLTPQSVGALMAGSASDAPPYEALPSQASPGGAPPSGMPPNPKALLDV
jgi:simple sugar transport system ATP-binding protein